MLGIALLSIPANLKAQSNALPTFAAASIELFTIGVSYMCV
jgi:hypothetical protein